MWKIHIKWVDNQKYIQHYHGSMSAKDWDAMYGMLQDKADAIAELGGIIIEVNITKEKDNG